MGVFDRFKNKTAEVASNVKSRLKERYKEKEEPQSADESQVKEEPQSVNEVEQKKIEEIEKQEGNSTQALINSPTRRERMGESVREASHGGIFDAIISSQSGGVGGHLFGDKNRYYSQKLKLPSKKQEKILAKRRKRFSGSIRKENRKFYTTVKENQNFYAVNTMFGYRSPFDRPPYIQGIGEHYTKLGKKVRSSGKRESIGQYTRMEKRRAREALTNANRGESRDIRPPQGFGQVAFPFGGESSTSGGENHTHFGSQKESSKRKGKPPQNGGMFGIRPII